MAVQIDIISDTVCPWCWIGRRRLQKALDARPDLTVEITWRPFQLNPGLPREGMDRRDHMRRKFGDPERAQAIFARIAVTAAEEGLDFRFDLIRRSVNTFDSHRLLHWAKGTGRQDKIAESLFRRYFSEGQDISDPAVLAAAAEEVGMDGGIVRDLLARDADAEIVRRAEATARALGVTSVPTFIFDQKIFVPGAQDAEMFASLLDRLAPASMAAG
jgi:predicted DsbA family dithiol-disulfide isomerase